MAAPETILAVDGKGRIVIPKDRRRAKHYRLIDKGDTMELILVQSFEDLKGKFPLKGSPARIEEEVEEKIIRKDHCS